MQTLMISLDKNILDPNSAVAQRMIEYGKNDELYIIIPCKEKKEVELSPMVKVWSTGGFKLSQFFRLWLLGGKIIHDSQFIIHNSLITAQDPFFTGLVGVFLKRKFGIKLEVQMHGDFFGEYYKKQWLRLCLAKFVLKRADRVRVVGERIKQSLIKSGISESKIEVRPILVDVEKIRNYQPKFNLHQKYPGFEKIFLVLGRLDSVKNIPWLIETFKEVVKQKSSYLLLVVGGGTEERNKMFHAPCLAGRQAYSMSHDNVKFEPWTNDPISYLKTADCVLFPSLSEGYGLVPIETNAAGIKVIMNDVGVANYELKPSDKVKILPINDRRKWVEAILNV